MGEYERGYEEVLSHAGSYANDTSRSLYVVTQYRRIPILKGESLYDTTSGNDLGDANSSF